MNSISRQLEQSLARGPVPRNDLLEKETFAKDEAIGKYHADLTATEADDTITSTAATVASAVVTAYDGTADIRKRAEKAAIEREEMEILEFIMIINAENYCNEHRMIGN